LNWDLKREERITVAEAARLGVVTISEREALDRVPPGKYTVLLETGGVTRRKTVEVREERAGVSLVPVRR
jgi:hypothetical protein